MGLIFLFYSTHLNSGEHNFSMKLAMLLLEGGLTTQ